ncbi:N-methyl-L-tryptophan oxidase [Planosporangium thailandense]|uniref:N-methyl-L-tryptophan oxidase n=1 Tax=Planosporangium thailandense TaxID=765197 RepID=A0ABX0XTT4_9ACTN|nr:N-methyl-L-tryptophan oxidase [Planosporangium thailandense]NJC69236.1 N-methyl-L-tryptophan oxidase [Planosporangium thailandense]
MDAQIGVVGLGAAGSMALWRIAAGGGDVLGFEQFAPGHARGSSHGQSRLFRLATSEGAHYAAMARRARELWMELERISGDRILLTTGGLSIGQADSELLTSVRRVADELDLPLEQLDADQLARRFPQHHYRPGDVALLDPNTGVLLSERAITAATAAATAAGGRVYADTPVLEIVPGDDSVTIVTAERTFEVRTAVVAAGAWQGRLLPSLQEHFTVRRAILTWFEPRAQYRAAFDPETFPVFTHDVGAATGWGAARIDSTGVKVGMQDNEGYRIDDPAANASVVAPAEMAAVTDYVAEYVPTLEPRVVRSRGCMITMTPDSGFVIGRLPDHPNVIVLSACSGHGFKHAAAVGDIGADLALTGTTSTDLSPFAPDRFAAVG